MICFDVFTGALFVIPFTFYTQQLYLSRIGFTPLRKNSNASTMEDPVSSPSSSTYQPDSPSASTFLRTAQTLEDLAKQLENLKDEVEDDTEVRCCCSVLIGEAQCEMGKERRSVEDKLKLSGGMFISVQLGLCVV